MTFISFLHLYLATNSMNDNFMNQKSIFLKHQKIKDQDDFFSLNFIEMNQTKSPIRYDFETFQCSSDQKNINLKKSFYDKETKNELHLKNQSITETVNLPEDLLEIDANTLLKFDSFLNQSGPESSDFVELYLNFDHNEHSHHTSFCNHDFMKNKNNSRFFLNLPKSIKLDQREKKLLKNDFFQNDLALIPNNFSSLNNTKEIESADISQKFCVQTEDPVKLDSHLENLISPKKFRNISAKESNYASKLANYNKCVLKKQRTHKSKLQHKFQQTCKLSTYSAKDILEQKNNLSSHHQIIQLSIDGSSPEMINIFSKKNKKLKINFCQKTTQRSIHSRNSFLSNLLTRYYAFSFEFMSKILNSETNFENCFKSDLFCSMIDMKIENIKKNLLSEDDEMKNQKCNLIMHRFSLGGFCSFCVDDSCLFSSNMNDFRDMFDIKNVISTNSGRFFETLLFFHEIEQGLALHETDNLYSFFSNFTVMRKKLEKFICYTKKHIIRFKLDDKREIMKNLQHNFKSKNLELKIILIPEFYSLAFFMRNIDSTFHYFKYNFIFFSVYFHLKYLEYFLDFVAQNEHFFVIDNDNQRRLDQRKQILLSLFIRINFIGPLVIFFTKSQKALFVYQLHFLSLFKMEFQYMKNMIYDKIGLNFFRSSIWWICNYDKKLSSAEILDFFDQKNVNIFLCANYNHICVIAHLMIRLKQIQSNILNDSLIENINMKHLKNYIEFCEKWIFSKLVNK